MPANAATSRPASDTPNPWEKKELGCLWKKSKKGTNEGYLTGVISLGKVLENIEVSSIEELRKLDLDLICFSNKNKKKDTHPDVRIYYSEPRASAAPAPAAARPAAARAPRPAPPAPAAAPAPVDSSELI